MCGACGVAVKTALAGGTQDRLMRAVQDAICSECAPHSVVSDRARKVTGVTIQTMSAWVAFDTPSLSITAAMGSVNAFGGTHNWFCTEDMHRHITLDTHIRSP
jgi:hypothetical protein